LFNAYCRVLKELSPKVFVFENVYGLPSANGGGPWKEIIAAFSQLGYRLSAEVLDAADYGVPQHRERLIMVGYKVGDFTFPQPTHGPDSDGEVPLVAVEEAIDDLQSPTEPYHNNLGGLYGHLLPLVPEGLNYSYFTAEMSHPEPLFAWRSKFHDLLYKVRRNEPCRTIKAQPGKFTGPFHWKNRHFTVPELKRLQSFPDTYKLVGSFGVVMHQIGNSVPPRLAEVIAISVREQLLDPVRKLTYKVRAKGFRSTFRNRQRARSRQFADVARTAIQEQYGSGRPELQMKLTAAERRRTVYHLNPDSLFDRSHLVNAALPNALLPLYRVEVTEAGSHVDIKFDRIEPNVSGKATVHIEGLRKYMPEFDSVHLEGNIDSVEDVFHAWAAIEDCLVKRSRFYSLIDIYGHYANRGDTVRVTSNWEIAEKKPVVAVLNYFGDSLRCGDFIDRDALAEGAGIQGPKLDAVIASLRAVRFDVRSSRTHPIIGDGRILCTYPFPLLSPRALVESRVRLAIEEQESGLSIAS
jgi:DNA (cytosine-5)-methyltransferase 1